MARWLSDRAKEAMRLRDADADGVCRCVYCGCVLVQGANTTNPCALSIDHVFARAEGGEVRDPKNLVLACFACNRAKSKSETMAWLLGRFGAVEAELAWARVQERLARCAQWDGFVAAAKAAGFRA
jgi:5-methylcytosine-specific restriction endonuclease McrA